MTEDQLEQDALSWLAECGYRHVCGYDIAPDSADPWRDSFQQVLLLGRLREAIARLNPSIPLAAREDALANNEASALELGDEILAKIAHELAASLRENITVDWSQRENVRAKLRLMVKRILRKYKYPPDQQEEAITLVLQQAETVAEGWCVAC